MDGITLSGANKDGKFDRDNSYNEVSVERSTIYAAAPDWKIIGDTNLQK